MRASLAVLLLLAGCDDMRIARKGEVHEAEINARIAQDGVARMERRLIDLEEKQREILQDLAQLEAMDRAISDDLTGTQNVVAGNARIANGFRREYDQHTH